MSTNTARCPCCGRELVVKLDGTFPRHQVQGPNPRRHADGTRDRWCGRAGWCLGSRWLVELEDVA